MFHMLFHDLQESWKLPHKYSDAPNRSSPRLISDENNIHYMRSVDGEEMVRAPALQQGRQCRCSSSTMQV